MGPMGPIGLMGWKVAARIFHSVSGKSQGKTHRISRIRSSLFCRLKKGIRRCLSAKPWLMRRYWRNACIVSDGGELKQIWRRELPLDAIENLLFAYSLCPKSQKLRI